ncbi:unnamed protein product [Cuscuta europaea]|uniref:Uncharacterized protein n=1 Tax=Cuscuta europaea TaxID=41803 RepID=A0A9P0Z1A4_CUSEU|nr:unnamed protein product [Cuscuta europaea]
MMKFSVYHIEPALNLTSGPSSTAVSQPPPVVQDSRKKQSGKELVRKGGVFNEVVEGHDVISQAVLIEDRTYLDKLENVRIYDGGMDLIVQGAFMLMESHKRQQQEIARLKEAEQKAASAEEAMNCLERLRGEVEALKKRADEADAAYCQVAADRDDALTKLAGEKEAREADRLRADEAEKAKAEAEKAADAAIEKFLADGWKAGEHRPWCYELVAARLEDWGQNSLAGQEYFEREMSVYYDMGQQRMQRLIYQRLHRRFTELKLMKKFAAKLKLPPKMKDPEAEVNLPAEERQSPILSSDIGEEDWGDDDIFVDTASSQADDGADTLVHDVAKGEA